MKAIKTGCWLLVFASFVNSCSKSNVQAGGGNTPPGSDSIAVTGIIPAQPYVDDVITINGTNFNADPAKDTVNLGVISNTVGSNGQPGFTSKLAYRVISASATQLKIKLATATAIQDASFALTSPFDLTFAKGFSIAANGKHKILSVPFKFLPGFSATSYTPNTITQSDFVKNYAGCHYGIYGSPYLYIYEGDSLLLDGFGMNNASITLNGKAFSSFTIKEDTKTKRQHLAGLVPYGFFGEAEPPVADRCPNIGTRVLEIKLTNADGKSVTFNKGTYFPSPNTGIYSYGLTTGNSFQQSNINLQPIYKIVGYALRSSMKIRIVGIRNGVVIYDQLNNVPGGYPNEFSFGVDMKVLPGPPVGGDSYTVTLVHEASGAVVKGAGGNGFTLNP
jgi:hypothetical protein